MSLIHANHLDMATAIIAYAASDAEFEAAGLCPDCILAWCSSIGEGDPADAGSTAASIMTGIAIGVRAARLKDGKP